MDFNDLDSKLTRLFQSVGEHVDRNIHDNIVDEIIFLPNGHFEIRTSFGANKPAKNQNLVLQPIHQIASLKDIIKTKLKDIGGNPKDYEKLIDNNLSLALLTDLDNKDKHGDPLTRSNRSKRDPKIINIQQGLRGKGITKVEFTTDLTTGKTVLDSKEGDVSIQILAEITDSKGNKIMTLEQMLNNSIEAIELFIEEKGISDYYKK